MKSRSSSKVVCGACGASCVLILRSRSQTYVRTYVRTGYSYMACLYIYTVLIATFLHKAVYCTEILAALCRLAALFIPRCECIIPVTTPADFDRLIYIERPPYPSCLIMQGPTTVYARTLLRRTIAHGSKHC